MPELPEVETVRRGLRPLLVGRRILDAGSHPSPKFEPASQVVGAVAVDIDRRGKYLLIPMDDHRRLIIHLGMTGRLCLRTPGDPVGPHVRAWWHLDGDRTLDYHDIRRFGRIAVVGEDLSGLPTLAQLGPEPFCPSFTPERLWSELRRSRSHIKTQLLNQRVVAGVGNIYADEALWRAGINPASRQISRPAASRLHAAIVAVLDEGIRHGGTTFRDYRNVAGRPGLNQHRLDCYGRAGAACRRCDETLRRRVVDARGTTFCPRCQRR